MATRTDEHLDVLIVGAGLSGIAAGRYVGSECPWASFAILEARDAIGGTWDLFRYPGVRSDSDMFTLGYSFRPWPEATTIADGPSILHYIKDTAAETGVDKKIRFGHRVRRTSWSTPDACWHVTAERTDSGDVVELTCNFLFVCSGYYRYDHGYLPEFPASETFAGTLVHPQQWPEELDYAGKRVVVIGSGATAVTLVPAMAPSAGHVTMLQRSPSYIGSLPQKSPIAALVRRLVGDQHAGTAMRWILALLTQGFYQYCQRRPDQAKRMIRARLERELPADYDIDTHFCPSYDPWDQRFCVVPDGDLFKAIRNGSVSVVTDHIERFTKNGIILRSGTEIPADIVVTATGLELQFLGGMEVLVDGTLVDPSERLTYKGMMLERIPNLAMAFGYTNASWTLKCELTFNYVTRLLNYMHTAGMRQCTPVNDDASVGSRPMLTLSSGYVQRATHLMPKQGTRIPWQVHQSYLRDYRALKRSRVDDGAMRFTNPVPSSTPADVPA